jgi:hypothetical protein
MEEEVIMEIPDHLRVLVDQLGQAMVQALVNDSVSRELAKQIQAEGFDIALMLEATVALRLHGETDQNPNDSETMGAPDSEGKAENEFMPRAYFLPDPSKDIGGPSALPDWSDADKAFLKTFKISLE